MKYLSIIVIVLFAVSCQTQVNFEPRKVNYDRDVCHVCQMGLTDPKFDVQAINQYGDVRFYDDIGCLAEDIHDGDFNTWKGEKYKIWIGNIDDGTWIDAEKALYRYGETTPMGYGYAAVKATEGDSLYNFKSCLQRIKEGKTMREEFIKKKKMSIGGSGKGSMKCAPGKCGGN